jgi:hypothetical protein
VSEGSSINVGRAAVAVQRRIFGLPKAERERQKTRDLLAERIGFELSISRQC